MVPAWATKQTHRAERDLVKVLVLAIGYGMGEQSLALRIGKPAAYARELLRAYRQAYRRFGEWCEAAVSTALFRGKLWTRYGWQAHTSYRKPKRGDPESVRLGNPNVRSLANFPSQGNAADMLRLAAVGVCDANVQLDATVHDAVLIEEHADDLDEAIRRTRAAMNRASEQVLYGFRLRTDVTTVVWPDRYRDERGAAFFDELTRRLDALRHRPTWNLFVGVR
jgi:DNA polymerase I-like protein with 3'-5' exonuclease and polymerase domains